MNIFILQLSWPKDCFGARIGLVARQLFTDYLMKKESEAAVAVVTDKATQKDTMPGPASSQTVMAAVKFGGDDLLRKPKRERDIVSESSSSVVSLSDSEDKPTTRRKNQISNIVKRQRDEDRSVGTTAVAATKRRSVSRPPLPRKTAVAAKAVAKESQRDKDRSVKTTAVAATKRRSLSRPLSRRTTAVAVTARRTTAVDATEDAATKRRATAGAARAVAATKRRSCSRQPLRRTTTAVAATKRQTTAVADTAVAAPKRRPSSSRSPSREQERSRKTKAVAAPRKRRQSISRSPPAPSSFVERKHIQPRRDLQQKQRVREPAFGYSSSGDERACRSGGMRVRGSLKPVRVHESAQPACSRDGGHTEGRSRGTRVFKKCRAYSIDSRDVSPVAARRERSASESPPTPRLVARENCSSLPQLREPEESALLLRPRSPLQMHSAPQSTPVDDPQSTSMHCRIPNLMFGTSYVANLADLAGFEQWLGARTHHCHVILCESSHSAVAEWLKVCSGAKNVVAHKKIISITNRVYLVLNGVTLTGVKQVLNCDDMTYAVAEINIHDRSTAPWHGGGTAVAVAIVHVLPQLTQELPDWLLEKMKESVKVYRVRCFTGTFGITARQMSTFALRFPLATPHVVCQMWRGTASTDVFPCYTMLLGLSRGMNVLESSDLVESAVAVKNNWVPCLYPYQDIMPYWFRRNQSDEYEGEDLDWGFVKVKKIDPAHWIAHVHQVLFWCGTSQQGVAAKYRARKGKPQSKSSSSKALQSVKVEHT